MRLANRVLRDRDRAQKEAARLADKQAALERQKETERAYRLEQRKAKAYQDVMAAAHRATERLNSHEGAGWLAKGHLQRVCAYSGPHRPWLCWLHRRTIALVDIPDMHKQEWVGRYLGVKFYVGEDGRIYRDGCHKIYRAELMKRKWPREITVLARKIDKICPK